LKTLPNMVSKWVPRQMPTLHELTLDGTIKTSVVEEANWRTRDQSRSATKLSLKIRSSAIFAAF
jgi:hypothetical protein